MKCNHANKLYAQQTWVRKYIWLKHIRSIPCYFIDEVS